MNRRIETSMDFTTTFKSGGVLVQVRITLIILNRFLQMWYQNTRKKLASSYVIPNMMQYNVSQHDYTRRFAVKLILTDRQKYEPRSTILIFDKFFPNIHYTKHNHNQHFLNETVEHYLLDWSIEVHINFNI